MLRNLWFGFYILQIVIFAHGTGLYSIVGPGTIRSNYKYNVAISVHKADEPCQVKVGITGPSYKETKTVQVQPMSTQNVEFDVPKLIIGDYNLTAVGLSGITFENSTRLNYADNKPSIFIQTDKATYKPGDLVQFRVMFLDPNTRPAKLEQPAQVVINDGAQNRIKQWKDVKPTQGVFTSELQLSDQPVLGDWMLQVSVGEENVENKNFEVAKYVLPKFDVSIETAKDVAIPDGVIKVTVRSKYTYGKSVKGKATVSIKPSYHYYGSNNDQVGAEKTIAVDGKGHVNFDLTKDLHLSSDLSYVPPLKVLAVMEEELTGNKQNTTTTVNLHAERYRIEGIDSPYTYNPGKPIIFNVVVKNLDGSPVRDTKNPVKLSVEPPRNYFYRGITTDGTTTTERPEQKTLEYEAKLDDNGMATFEFTLPENNNTFYSVKSQFLETTAYLSSLSKFSESAESPELLKLTVNTKKPQLGKDVSVEIKSSEPIPYFVYVLVARGNILRSEHVEVPEGRKSHTIQFPTTFDMIPKAKLYVHYVDNNNLRFEEVNIDFEKDFQNSIKIDAQARAKPGEDVQLKIKTDPGSYVGLLGIDRSVSLLKTGNDFSKDMIFNSLNNFDSNTPYMRGYGRYPGQQSGLVTMTNANYPYNDDWLVIRPLYASIPGDQVITFGGAGLSVLSGAGGGGGGEVPPPAVRKEFPENWIFQNVEHIDGGNFTLSKKIPDTITSWSVTGFSVNPDTGVALTDKITEIEVFQPFFISTNLPYSVKRGEVISIPIVIFNYMDKDLDVEVTMENIDLEYEFTEATNEVEESSIEEVKRIKRVTVPSNTGKSVSFMVRPKKVGDITLKMTAITPLAGDAIHQMLKVEPEGVTQFENRAVFINLQKKPEQSGTLMVDIPVEAVPDSEYIEFEVVGDLLGPTIKNLDKLVRMPSGCGEQNMVNFVPNILVLKYLDTIGQNRPNVAEKAKKFLEIGYQRELTYKHDDGSYSAFGKSDPAGSTWLTAYVVRSFHQAANYTDIQPEIIIQGLEFLASKQAENGSFPEYGRVIDSAHHNELGLTSYVLLAFLENVEHKSKYQPQIALAVKFISENAKQSDDQYSLAIAASALQKAGNSLADEILVKLEGLAKQESDRKWWSTSPEDPSSMNEKSKHFRPQKNDVEMTSYVLLALLEKESAEAVLPIVRWLISQRNSNGGFSSTQDTVVGLQSLIKFAEMTGSGAGEMSIDFVATSNSPEMTGAIKVSPTNSMVLQSHILPKSTRQVDYNAKGTGSAMVQLSYRYNIVNKDKKPSFKVNATVNEKTLPQQLNVEVCAEFVPLESAGGEKESNMAVLEVALPSGYTADADSFDRIGAVDRVKLTETKNSDSTVVVYFDGLPVGDPKCVNVEASKTHAVAKQKPAAVTIYDYYDTERRATEYYEIKSSLCDICEGDDCGAGCKKGSKMDQ